MKVMQNNANIAEIQSRLNKYPYLSKNTLPGFPDGKVFTILQSTKRFPDRKVNPNFYHWYIIMKQFSPSTISKWITEELYLQQEDSLINEFIKVYAVRKDSPGESAQSAGSQGRSLKFENPLQIEYTIDITLKDYTVEKMNSLRKVLEEYNAEMTEEEINNSKLFRILCRIDPVNHEEFKRRINESVEYNQFAFKRKDMKGQKTVSPSPPPQKND